MLALETSLLRRRPLAGRTDRGRRRVSVNRLRAWGVLGIAGLLLSGCGPSEETGTESAGEAPMEVDGAPDEVARQDWSVFRGGPEMQGRSPIEDLAPPLELAWEFRPPAEPAAKPPVANTDVESDEGGAAESGSGAKPDAAAKEGADEGNAGAASESASPSATQASRPRRIPPFTATAVVADGRVYVGSEEGRFFCLDLEDGTLLWEHEAEGSIGAPAAVFGDRVYFGDKSGYVFALDRVSGEEIWRFECDDQIEGGVNALEVPVPDEGSASGESATETRLFIGSHDTYLYCLRAEDGEEIWRLETANAIISTPSVATTLPAITFGGCDGFLHVVSADTGEALRQVEVEQYIANTAAIDGGIAYISHYGGEILAIDLETGEIIWKVTTGTEYHASPALSDRLVYVAGRDKKLIALDRVTGEVQWEFLGRRDFDSSPLVTSSAIFIGGMDGRLYAVSPDEGQELWSYELGARLSSSPVLSQGKLVICGEDGVVYAFARSETAEEVP